LEHRLLVASFQISPSLQVVCSSCDNMGAACARRRPPPPELDGQTPFWEEVDKARAPLASESKSEASETRSNENEDAERSSQAALPSEPEPKDEAELPGYDEAARLKDQGKDRFAKGEVSEAVTCWMHALDGLPPPSAPPQAMLGGLLNGKAPKEEEKEDHRILEMRVALLLNLALAHTKLKKFRQAVGFCNEALVDEPQNVKALYRKADALGELCDWQEAEEAAGKLQATGEEGAKLASQKREEWRRRRKQSDGKQKKMWSAALEKVPEKEQANGKAKETSQTAEEAWTAPKLQVMSTFDLRQKCISWEEDEDFSDSIWKDSLGRKEAMYYQKRALPLTLLAAASLAKLDMQSELVVHCLLDGNMAPFSEPHDWTLLLKRCPEVRSILVVYIDVGAVPADKEGKPPVPYGTLMRPTEEGRLGDRVARAARFMGTYHEFKVHCRDLPGLVRPSLALWADVPLYGFGDEDFRIRLQALSMLCADGVPSVVTQGGEVQEPGMPPMAIRPDEFANISMAVISEGLALKELAPWHWNRFVVPLDRGQKGILAAHALVAVFAPGSKKDFAPETVKAALKRRCISPTPYKMPRMQPPQQQDKKLAELRERQWQAFCKQLHDQGRQIAGPDSSEEEMRRQTMEWYRFVGASQA